MGYERQGGGGGQASRLAREIETMSASSGSVNARRRTNRGTLEQVNILVNALHTSNKIYLRLLKERVLTVEEKKTTEVSIGGLKELDRITE